jgi:hypothetical protein
VPAASPGHPSEQPCSEPGCQAENRVSCDYRDRRGIPVPDGVVRRPRRDGQLLASLPPSRPHRPGPRPRGVPRASCPRPTWTTARPRWRPTSPRRLDSRMRAALTALSRPASGERVGTEALTLVTDQNRGRRWAQGWKLFDNTGPLLRIDVEVDEARDPECALRLNSRVILRCVPPWIQDRKAHGATGGGGRGREAPSGLLRRPHGAARLAGAGRRRALGAALGALAEAPRSRAPTYASSALTGRVGGCARSGFGGARRQHTDRTRLRPGDPEPAAPAGTWRCSRAVPRRPRGAVPPPGPRDRPRRPASRPRARGIGRRRDRPPGRVTSTVSSITSTVPAPVSPDGERPRVSTRRVALSTATGCRAAGSTASGISESNSAGGDRPLCAQLVLPPHHPVGVHPPGGLQRPDPGFTGRSRRRRWRSP